MRLWRWLRSWFRPAPAAWTATDAELFAGGTRWQYEDLDLTVDDPVPACGVEGCKFCVLPAGVVVVDDDGDDTVDLAVAGAEDTSFEATVPGFETTTFTVTSAVPPPASETVVGGAAISEAGEGG